MSIRAFHPRIVAAVGAVMVVVGTYLPGFQTNPSFPPDARIPAVYLTGMISGIAGGDFGLLGFVGATVLLHLAMPGTRLQAVGTMLAGGGVVAFCFLSLSTSSLIGFAATFVPVRGWYATVAGGLFLVVSGAVELAWIGQIRPLTRDSRTGTP